MTSFTEQDLKPSCRYCR